MSNDILETLNSVERALLGYVGDISADKRLSWIYGILIGWSDECLKEYSEKHHIKQCDIERLKSYRNCYLSFKKQFQAS